MSLSSVKAQVVSKVEDLLSTANVYDHVRQCADESKIAAYLTETYDPVYHLYAEDKTGGGTAIAKYHTADVASIETWKYDGTALKPESDGWDKQDVSSPVVWIEGDTWYMLFEGRATGNQGAIGLATSTDGKTWTKSDANPVAWGTEYVAAESADDCCTWADHIVPDDVYKEAGTYWMLFHGYDTSASNWYMGVLASTDLTTWTEPWAHPIWNAAHGYYAGTLQFANTSVLGMYYQSDDLYDVYPSDASGNRAATMAVWNGEVIGQDTSSPFVERGVWDATIREPGNMLYDASQTNTRKLWYTGYSGAYTQTGVQIGYAYSTDGATWVKSASNPVIERSLEDPFIVQDSAATGASRVHWWTITLADMQLKTESNEEARDYYTFYIDGFMAVADTLSTGVTFEEIVQDIVDAFANDLDLGGTTESGDYPGDGITGVGIPRASIGTSDINSQILLHAARITLTVRDATLRTLTT